MKNKIGWLKISICAAFLAVFGAATFFTQTFKVPALKTSAADAENPQTCAACHQQEFSTWHQNAHRKTVRKATIENVRGDFSAGNNLDLAGVKAEMTGDGENFFVKIGVDSYRIEAIVGVEHLEQYVAEKDGEFYSLPIAYDLKEKRWTNLNETGFEKKTADFSAHLKNWKTDCAACHQSGANDLSNGFSDVGISCAACHGNAAEHLESKNSLWARIGFATESKIVNPQKLSSDAAMMVCAQCHARDSNEPPKFDEFADEKRLDTLVSAHRQADSDSEKYWADGSNKFSGNEFQAIVRSVCYAQSKAGGHGIAGEKINCASCHSLHETDDELPQSEKSFDQSCVNCHTQYADDAAIVEHTKHPLDSEASRCASCHQPETVYERMRFTRTHEISVPNPMLTVKEQMPNACNLCHTDKSVNWAIASSKKLWSERFSDGKVSTDKQFDQPESARLMSSNDAFLRALAADSLQKHSDSNRSAPFSSAAFQTEPSPLVNYFIRAALQPTPPNLPKKP